MATTEFQRGILRLLAPSRKARESYVAGGVALNTLLRTPRLSTDIDFFHDRVEAVERTVDADRELLSGAGYQVAMLRQAPTFAEAVVRRGDESTILQWAQDSAFRFFPLLAHEELGLTLHPFDLATNKVMAMAGRLEARDWVDLLSSIEQLQPLGYLVWAGCGKDPGFNPDSLLQEVRRSGRYTQPELDRLDFGGGRLDAAALGVRWHAEVAAASAICQLLPVEAVGTCVTDGDGELFRGDADELATALVAGRVRFHQGTLGGAWPSFRPNHS